nr:MAG TPA: hypothetical protein [Caudoviricetes sp.]
MRCRRVAHPLIFLHILVIYVDKLPKRVYD